MSSIPRILLKLVLAIPLCLITLLGPFFLVQWVQETYGVHIPSMVILAIALGLTLSIYFSIFKAELDQAARKQPEKKAMSSHD